MEFKEDHIYRENMSIYFFLSAWTDFMTKSQTSIPVKPKNETIPFMSVSVRM